MQRLLKRCAPLAEYLVQPTLAGIACGVTMAYLLGNHGVVWGTLGEWFAGGAALITAWAAWVQLGRLNESERLSNSLRVVDDVNESISLNGFQMTPFDSFGSLQDLVNDRSKLDNYRKSYHDFINGIVKWGDDSNFLKQRAVCSIASNYFVNVASLMERGKLDRVLVLERVGDSAAKVLNALQTINDPAWNLETLQEFVDDARHLQTERGELN
jgi:hypothetical protein